MRFPCPYLGSDVELSEEREKHILERHPDLPLNYREYISKTLADPDLVRRSARSVNTRLFSHWFGEMMGGKHIVVVVVSEVPACRHWVITGYLMRKLVPGDVEWKRN